MSELIAKEKRHVNNYFILGHYKTPPNLKSHTYNNLQNSKYAKLSKSGQKTYHGYIYLPRQ